MILSIKHLTPEEAGICMRTLSSKAAFAIVGDAIMKKQGLSIVRMGDGEVALLEAKDGEPFTRFSGAEAGWNARLGIDGMPIEEVKANILEAGNDCTYFAPSISGISRDDFKLHHRFRPRDVYIDNFFVNDWTHEMLRILLSASGGVFILHKDYEALIDNFVQGYGLPRSHFAGATKRSGRDNDASVAAAARSGKQLVLFSAGPAGKAIGPRIAESGKVALDVGNTLPAWSLGGRTG